MKTIKKRINIPIYNTYLQVIITDKFRKYAKKYEFEGDHRNYDGFVQVREINDNHAIFYLLVTRRELSYKAIVHEAKHIVNKIFNNNGIGLDPMNDEAECYFLGWLADEIHKCFK